MERESIESVTRRDAVDAVRTDFPFQVAPPEGTDRFFARLCRSWAVGLESGTRRAVAARADGLFDRTRGWDFHLEPEFFLQLSGVCHFRFPHQRIDLTAGTLLMLPAGLPHRERVCAGPDGPFRNAVLMPAGIHLAGPSPYNPELPAGGIFRYAGPDGGRELRAALNHAGNWPGAAREDILRPLCAGLLRLIAAECEFTAPPLENVRHSPKVAAAVALIRNRSLGVAPGVAELAKVVGCTPNYLSARFRSETGMRICEFINRDRLESARRMLETTGFQIAEIAWSCGFQDAGYFSELFRHYYGVLPSAVRTG